MARHLFYYVVLLVLSTAAVSGFYCNERPDVNCDDYFNRGGITVILEELSNIEDFDEPKFSYAVANVSNDYVILEVVPSEHVAVTEVAVNNGMVEVSFFVLNPSGSVVVPTAFRSQELFLMMKLNDAKVEALYGQSVKPIDPKPETVAIPIWAIAILGYVGVVILCAMGMYATRDWRKRKQQELEESLSMSDMEKGKQTPNGTKIPLNDYNQIKPQEKQPKMKYAEAGVQTDRGIPRAKSKEKKAKMETAIPEDSGQISNGHTVQATIENGGDDVIEKDKPVTDNTVDEESPAEVDVDEGAGGEIAKDMEALVDEEERQDDTKALETEGAVNEAFDDDEEKEEKEDKEEEEEKEAEEEEEEEDEEEEEEEDDEEEEEDDEEEGDTQF